MFSQFLFILASSVTTSFFNAQMVGSLTETFEPEIKNIHIPIGFDDNDQAEVIVEVEFTNTCQEFGRSFVREHEDFPDTLLLYVEGIRKDGFCTQVKNRDIVSIPVGRKPAGIYEIRSFKDLSRRLGKLSIREAQTSKIDDSLYAPISSVLMTEDPLGIRRILTLTGHFSNTCLKFEKILIAKTAPSLIEVLPIITMEDRLDCEDREHPFLIQQGLPEHKGDREITAGRYVFHVRKMNGGAVNKIDYVQWDDSPLIP